MGVKSRGSTPELLSKLHPLSIGEASGIPNIYAFHRYTRNSAFLSDTLASQFRSPHGVKPRTFKTDLRRRLRALYAQ